MGSRSTGTLRRVFLRSHLRLTALVAFAFAASLAAATALLLSLTPSREARLGSLQDFSTANREVIALLHELEEPEARRLLAWLSRQFGAGGGLELDLFGVEGGPFRNLLLRLPGDRSGLFWVEGGEVRDAATFAPLGPTPPHWRGAAGAPRLVSEPPGSLALTRLEAAAADTFLVPVGGGRALALTQAPVRPTGSAIALTSALVLFFSWLAVLLPFGLLAVLLDSLLARREARRLAAPLERLERTARALASGDLGARAPEAGPDEVRALATSMNEMGRSLERSLLELQGAHARTEAAFRSQRKLLENVSHDLRTPLASLLAHAEALERAPDAHPYARVLHREAQALARLVDDLFDLV